MVLSSNSCTFYTKKGKQQIEKKYPEDIGGHNKCILCQRKFQNYKAFRLMKYIARYNVISCNRYQEILDRNERND